MNQSISNSDNKDNLNGTNYSFAPDSVIITTQNYNKHNN